MVRNLRSVDNGAIREAIAEAKRSSDVPRKEGKLGSRLWRRCQPARIVRVIAARGSSPSLPRKRTTALRRPLPSRRRFWNVTVMRYEHDVDDSVARRVEIVLPARVLNCADTRPPLQADGPTPAGRRIAPLMT